jgi:hypothetical protein
VSIIWGGIFTMLGLRKRLPRAWRRGTETERFMSACPTYFAIGLIGFSVSCFFLSFAWADIVYILAVFMSGLYIAVREYKATPARIAAHVTSDDAPEGGCGTRFNRSGGLALDGVLRYVSRILDIADADGPFATVERFAKAGLRALGKRIDQP